MADRTVTPSLALTLAEYERRIRTLETAAQLGNSSIKGGALRVLRSSGAPVAAFGEDSANTVGTVLYDSSGNVIAAFGQIPALSGSDGVQLGATAAPTFLWNQDEGQLRPHTIVPFSPNAAAYQTTSATFVLAHDAYVERTPTKYLHMRTYISIDPGCTAEIRMTHLDASGTLLATSNTQTLSSVPGQIYNVQLAWAPTSLATLGQTARFKLEIRRTAGAAQVGAYPPYGLELGDFRTTATSGGAWTYV